MQGLYVLDSPMHLNVPRAKLKLKIPMQQVVIDIEGRMYKYIFTKEGIRYIFCGCVLFE